MSFKVFLSVVMSCCDDCIILKSWKHVQLLHVFYKGVSFHISETLFSLWDISKSKNSTYRGSTCYTYSQVFKAAKRICFYSANLVAKHSVYGGIMLCRISHIVYLTFLYIDLFYSQKPWTVIYSPSTYSQLRSSRCL